MKITKTEINTQKGIITKTTTYPNGDKVQTIRTKDLGTFVKVTRNGKTQIHQIPNDVYEQSEKLAKLSMLGNDE